MKGQKAAVEGEENLDLLGKNTGKLNEGFSFQQS